MDEELGKQCVSFEPDHKTWYAPHQSLLNPNKD